MGFPKQKDKKKFVFNKGSYKSQCAYMLMLIRNKDPKAWLGFKQEFASIKDEDSYDFFEKLVAFYKGEEWQEKNVVELKPTQPIVKEIKKEEKEKKEDKKEMAKKKKVTKKKTKKKVTKKKPAKKPAKKKVTKKKVTKKKVTKKKTSKTSKKSSKVTKKKAAKKVTKKKVTKKK